MASLADDNGMNGTAAKPPIAAHPAFPFIVALWFAALLGLGSLVVPVPLIESFTVATGLAAIVPPTAPPLGFTARALMALAFGAGGALAGLVIARQIAKAHQAPPARRISPPGIVADRRPISAHDELGDEGLDGRPQLTQPRGRRALALNLEEESARSPDLEHADLEHADPLDLTDDALELSAFAPQPDPSIRSVDATPGFTTFSADSRNDTMDDRQFFHTPSDDFPAEERQEFHFPSAIEQATPLATRLTQSVAVAWDDEEEQDDDQVDALDFSPPSLAHRTFANEDGTGEDAGEYESENDMVSQVLEDHRQFANFGADQQFETADHFTVPESGEDGPDALDDLGLVQLAQRLGASIEKRREQRAARAALAASTAHQVFAPVMVPADPLVDALADEFDVAEPDEAAQAMAAYFSRPEPALQPASEQDAVTGEYDYDDEDDGLAHASATPRFPHAEFEPQSTERQVFRPVAEPEPVAPPPYLALAGMARIDIDDEDEEEGIADLAASFSLPLAGLAFPAVAPNETQDNDDEEPDSGSLPDFGSLMATGNPFRQQAQQFVRIEDEPEASDSVTQPAVVFPGEAPPVSASVSAPVSTFGAAPFETPAFQPQARVNSEEHERALRDALLNLQRMSGAA